LALKTSVFWAIEEARGWLDQRRFSFEKADPNIFGKGVRGNTFFQKGVSPEKASLPSTAWI
jgi:hypothetical protein